jgi:hypothetical protein
MNDDASMDCAGQPSAEAPRLQPLNKLKCTESDSPFKPPGQPPAGAAATLKPATKFTLLDRTRVSSAALSDLTLSPATLSGLLTFSNTSRVDETTHTAEEPREDELGDFLLALYKKELTRWKHH